MSKKFKTYLVDKDKNERIDFCGEFSDEEWELLEHFIEESEKLFESEIYPLKIKGNFKINWNEEEGFTDDSTLLSDDEFSILLHRLRPFVLQNESIHLPKVCNYLKKRIKHPKIVQWIDEDREMFLGRRFESLVKIKCRNQADSNLNDIQINSEETLKKWLNAFEYHRDEPKRAEFKSMEKFLPNDTQKAIFTYMLVDKVRAITRLFNIIYNIIKSAE